MVKCTAKNSRPAPSFVWTVDEVALDHKTENMFDEESAIFTQILHFVPSLEHANKTLRCTVQHPGLEKEISASTEVKLSGEAPVSMMGALTWELEGIIITVLALLFIAGMVFIIRKKCASKSEDLKKPVDEEKGAEVGDAETKPSEASGEKKEVEAETKLEVSTVEEKKGFELRSKVVKILANLKPKEKKMTDEVVASEFEKVELTDAEDKKDGECSASENQGFGAKLASFMSKFKPAAKSVDQETEETENKADAESNDQDKEVDLNPEKPEEQVLNRRRGSETPV